MSLNLPNIPGYDVDAELGRGGMGVVYRVRQHRTGTVLALKMILCGREATFQELARFRIEAEAMACLNHPNIIKIRDVGVFWGYPFFALEFAEKGSLKQVTRGRPQQSGWSAELVRTLAGAIQHAHSRGMLHRDLKPANVLVLGDGTPKISDFGLVKFAAPIAKVSESCCTFSVSILDMELARFARELGCQYKSISDATEVSEDELTQSAWQECATRTGILGDGKGLHSVRAFLDKARRQAKVSPRLDDLTHAGAIMGSPNYMAPEQAAGDLGKIGPPTDVYALGGILYELLTGQLPFSSRSPGTILRDVLTQPPRPPRQIDPTIPHNLEAICLKCLEKDVKRRYPRAQDLADDLQQFLDGYACHGLGQSQTEDATAYLSDDWRSSLSARQADQGGLSTRQEGQRKPSKGRLSTRIWRPFSRKLKG
jgi:serine/threonine-protein kinase